MSGLTHVLFLSGRHLSNASNRLGQNRRRVVEFIARRVSAQTETQASANLLACEPKRLQYVTRLERSGRARRTGRHRDAFQIERDQQALAVNAIEPHVQMLDPRRVVSPLIRTFGMNAVT